MIPGVFLSDSGIQGDVNRDFAAGILRCEIGGTAPLLALSSGMQSRDLVGSWSTMWFDEEHSSGRLKVATTQAAATTTSLVLNDASSVIPASIFLVEATGERIFVSDVSSNTLTIVRGFQDTGDKAAIISADDYIQMIGTAFPESSEPPTAVFEQGTPQWNVTQIFRTAWDVSNTAAVVQYQTGNKLVDSQRQSVARHAEEIERTLWYGKRAVMKQVNARLGLMGGVEFFNTSNVSTITTGTASTYSTINSFLESVFQYQISGAPQERLAFAGNTAIGIINEIAKSNTTMNITPGATTYGMKVFNWISPFGSISIMTHPMFNQNPVWSKNLWLLHPSSMVMCYLRRTRPYKVAETGRDAQAGGLTTELTAEFRCPKTSGALLNINKAG